QGEIVPGMVANGFVGLAHDGELPMGEECDRPAVYQALQVPDTAHPGRNARRTPSDRGGDSASGNSV
ncbi:MAG: hypothetical protein ABIP48_29035, partial [Planctomycetota bacterium]